MSSAGVLALDGESDVVDWDEAVVHEAALEFIDDWTPVGSRAYRVSKRVLDVGVASLGLLVLSPLLLLLALLIRLDSPGPSLFVQSRVGQRGRLFPMLKFRTMAHGSRLRLVGPHKRPDDDRVTRVGRLLRRASLDELPQLLNVLVGQMSLVGPRPELPA
ncbi:MAG TPA: sugar transferase, partial [Thermomicrobiaceae bacterium]|nr:sugar transferase [Thermomicrobiaceae bacterium]